MSTFLLSKPSKTRAVCADSELYNRNVLAHNPGRNLSCCKRRWSASSSNSQLWRPALRFVCLHISHQRQKVLHPARTLLHYHTPPRFYKYAVLPTQNGPSQSDYARDRGPLLSTLPALVPLKKHSELRLLWQNRCSNQLACSAPGSQLPLPHMQQSESPEHLEQSLGRGLSEKAAQETQAVWVPQATLDRVLLGLCGSASQAGLKPSQHRLCALLQKGMALLRSAIFYSAVLLIERDPLGRLSV